MREELTKLFADIANTKVEIETIKKNLSEKLQESFHKLAKDLFVVYPELKSFGWSQYTPYFNDGDTCEFKANTKYLAINGFDSHYDEFDDEHNEEHLNIIENSKDTVWKSGEGSVPNENYSPYCKEIFDTLQSFLGNFSDDDFKDLFGDHMTIRVTADRVTTKEYEHD